jgi:hypothetical protein
MFLAASVVVSIVTAGLMLLLARWYVGSVLFQQQTYCMAVQRNGTLVLFYGAQLSEQTIAGPLLCPCVTVPCHHTCCRHVFQCAAVVTFLSRRAVAVQCSINTWSAGGQNVPCTACPANTASPSTSTNIDACVCLPGYKPGSSGCVQCVSGEVCPGGTSGRAAVIQCPPGATSPPGSDSPADCVCQPGFGKPIMDGVLLGNP